jgi:hypothetical protein
MSGDKITIGKGNGRDEAGDGGEEGTLYVEVLPS